MYVATAEIFGSFSILSHACFFSIRVARSEKYAVGARVAQVILKILILPWWTTYHRQLMTQEPPVPVRANFSILITPVCDSWFLSFEYVAASCYLGQSCPDFLPASYSAS
jgi:hypothetical protein